MIVFPIGSLTDFVTELTMSIIGNSSLQPEERAIISASIVDRAVSVCVIGHGMNSYIRINYGEFVYTNSYVSPRQDVGVSDDRLV